MKTEKVGERITRYMDSRGMTISEMSLQTGLDTDFITSLRDNDVYPSLGPLLKIARALGLRLGTFLDDQITEDPLIIRREARMPELVTHKGSDKVATQTFHSLGRGKTDRHMEPFFIDIYPEPHDGRRLSSHEGEEFIVVDSGSIKIVYGAESFILNKGDSIYYNSIVPHYVSCNGDSKASIYAVLYFPK